MGLTECTRFNKLNLKNPTLSLLNFLETRQGVYFKGYS